MLELYNTNERLDEDVYLNLTTTKKFKTNLISFYIIRPLSEDEATKNALLPLVLRRGTKNYDTSLAIQRRLEELYGSNLSLGVSKKGERQVIRFTIEGPEGSFVKAEDFLKDQLKMIYDILYNPLVEDNKFSEDYMNQEKRNLRKKIEGRINDKKQYAVDRCIEEMCKNERFSIYKYGYLDDIDKIDGEKLYEHYHHILKTSPIYITIVGHVAKDHVVKAVNEIFNFKRDDVQIIPRENVLKEITTKNRVFEEMDVNQGKLTLGFRTNVPYEDDLYEALLLASNILGGGPNSKLFLNVREKESLAYYIYTKSYKYKSLMIIASGIEFKNFDKALEIVKEQVKEMKAGNFEEKDIQQAKNSIITSMRTMADNNFSISEFYLSQALTKDRRDIEEIVDKIQNITKDEIIKASKKISLDTIYFLRKKDTDEEESN